MPSSCSALLGIVWAFFFYRWFRDNPHEHPSVNDAERRLLTGVENLASRHAEVPWGVFFALAVGLAALDPVRVPELRLVLLRHLVPHLPRSDARRDAGSGDAGRAGRPPAVRRRLRLAHLGLLRGAARPAGRWRRPRAQRARRLRLRGRRRLPARRDSDGRGPLALAVLIGLAGLFNDFALPCAWGACMDVGGRFAGTFSGAMNMMGNLGGFIAPIATGYILDITGSWSLVFYISSAVYLLGALCWILLDPTTPLDRRPLASAREITWTATTARPPMSTAGLSMIS